MIMQKSNKDSNREKIKKSVWCKAEVSQLGSLHREQSDLICVLLTDVWQVRGGFLFNFVYKSHLLLLQTKDTAESMHQVSQQFNYKA